MIEIKENPCAGCHACCTGKVGNTHRTPMFASDIEKEYVTPIYEEGVDRDCATCVFIDPKTHLCTVYEKRPLICRTYPYYPLNIQGTLYLGLANREDCNYSKGERAKIYAMNDEELSKFCVDKLAEFVSSMNIEELNQFSAQLGTTYKLITVLPHGFILKD